MVQNCPNRPSFSGQIPPEYIQPNKDISKTRSIDNTCPEESGEEGKREVPDMSGEEVKRAVPDSQTSTPFTQLGVTRIMRNRNPSRFKSIKTHVQEKYLPVFNL